MKKDVEAKPPKVELATKDWTLKELMDTERRIEKAFHEQTQFLSQFVSQKLDSTTQKLDNTIRWMVGLVLSMTIAIIVAVLFKG